MAMMVMMAMRLKPRTITELKTRATMETAPKLIEGRMPCSALNTVQVKSKELAPQRNVERKPTLVLVQDRGSNGIFEM
jgi:hypothetical protein